MIFSKFQDGARVQVDSLLLLTQLNNTKVLDKPEDGENRKGNLSGTKSQLDLIWLTGQIHETGH